MRLWRKFASAESSTHTDQPSSISRRFRDTLAIRREGSSSENRNTAQENSPRHETSKPEGGHDQVALAEEEAIVQDSSQWGIFMLEDKAENAEGIVDIIAVHGLNGHYMKTWTTTSKEGTECNWLRDLLPKQIPNARIMSFGYNSAVQFSKSSAGIGSFADDLLENIMSWRGSMAEKARPVIFICHSLGGVVFKKVRNLS